MIKLPKLIVRDPKPKKSRKKTQAIGFSKELVAEMKRYGISESTLKAIHEDIQAKLARQAEKKKKK